MGIGASKNDISITRALSIAIKEIRVYTEPLVISVGSGYGQTEYKESQTHQIAITCVDPLLDDYADRSYAHDDGQVLMPHYTKISDFLRYNLTYNPDTSILILDWPFPNDSTYDIDAIRDLHPKYIVIRYCSHGAGGSMLHMFLELNGCPHRGTRYAKKQFTPYSHLKYTCKYEKNYTTADDMSRQSLYCVLTLCRVDL